MSPISDSSVTPWSIEAPTYADEQSQSLIQRCLAGEETAYVALYNQYAGMIFRLCVGLLQNREDAEEVLQDSFEYAFRRLDHYDARKSAFSTWLYRIAVSRCRNKRRRKWLPSFSLNAFDGDEPKDPAAAPPDETAVLSERQRAVWAAVGALSPKLREVAILRYYGGLQYAEIGAVLDIPPKTAESRMRLAHKALRERLSGMID